MRILAILVLCLSGMSAAYAAPEIASYIRKDRFEDIKISPSGDYLAATVPLEDRTVLVVMRRAGNAVTARFGLGRNTYISSFRWVSPDRVLISIAQKFGSRDKPTETGELFAVNADGSEPEMLVGFRVQGAGAGTRIQPKKVEDVAAFLVDELPQDDRYAIIAVWPFGDDPYTRAERLDVDSGRRVVVARAPIRRAAFLTDHQGVVRFAEGADTDNVRKLYYRADEASEWKLVNDESVTGNAEYPLGFSADGRIAYLQAERSQGPDAVLAFHVDEARKELVLGDEVSDPGLVLHDFSAASGQSRAVIGVELLTGKPRRMFFAPDSTAAALYGMLDAAFPGESVRVTSTTSDGRLALVQVSSDRNPGDYYLFDTSTRKADYLLSRRDWFDPAAMAEARPFQIKARDGMPLHGYMTLPPGRSAEGLPMIVLPHGGPFDEADYWEFNAETQMLANAGYAVLQVNFRGSGGYGRAFREAGAQQWGKAMQDDVTDATQWAIREGMADPSRICIYGASYGAYAALMGAAREPELYRCAAGYVGIYELQMLHDTGDIQDAKSGRTYLRDWVGDKEALLAVSPTQLATRIRAPVFLAAGGQDRRAPIEHTKLMENKLKAAGAQVESLYYSMEGHGFYDEAHQQEYYTRLLDFFSRNIGGEGAAR